MKIPHKLYIGGWVVPVRYRKAPMVVDGVECLGCYCIKDREIRLAKGMTPDRKREVFLHEFMHLAEVIYGIKISHYGIEQMAFALAQLFGNHNIDLNRKDNIKRKKQ